MRPRRVGNSEAIAGRSTPGSVLQHELRHRHQRAGVAGGNDAGRLAAGDRVDRPAHARVAPGPQGGRGPIAAADHLQGIANLDLVLEPAEPAEQRFDLAGAAEHQKADVGEAFAGTLQPLDHHPRRLIPAHRVDR